MNEVPKALSFSGIFDISPSVIPDIFNRESRVFVFLFARRKALDPRVRKGDRRKK